MAGTIKDRINNKVEAEFRDLDVEYQLMAYIVRKSPPAVSLTEETWFSDGILRDIHKVVRDLRVDLSKAMLLRELKERKLIGKGELALYKESVDQLYTVTVESIHDKNVRHLILQILKLFESRRVLMTIGEIIGDLRHFNLDAVKKKLIAISRPVGLRDHINAGYYLEDYPQRLEIMEEKKRHLVVDDENESSSVGISTGIHRFDKFSGGLMRKEFGVIGGITGVGKTAGLICFGLHAWKCGYDVMLASGEMSKDLLEFRIDANLAMIPATKFRLAELTDADYKKWDSTIKKYEAVHSDNYLYVVTFPRRFDISIIENEIVKLEEESGRRIDLLCIDYLNIMGSIGKNGQSSKEWASQAEAVWELKGLVTDHDIACWTAGQVKDEAYDKDLFSLDDLKYSRAISETSPVVIALIQDDKDILAKRMKLQVLKMRNAPLPLRPILLTPNMEFMRIHETMRLKSLKDLTLDTMDVKPKKNKYTPKKGKVK